MSIALKIGDDESEVQGFLYLDAVTMYSKSLKGRVSSHPVDSGANIADHFIAENPKFSLRGVVSDVEISGVSDMVNLEGRVPMNAISLPATPLIQGQEKSLQYLPSAVRQFFERKEATVGVSDATTPSNIPAVEALFRQLMTGLSYNQTDRRWRNKMTLTTLYEMNGYNFSNAHTDLVITSVEFSEDPDSGDALYLDISLEKVRFATLKSTELPKKATSNKKKKVAGTSDKGKQTVTEGTDTSNSKDAPKKLTPAKTFNEARDNLQ